MKIFTKRTGLLIAAATIILMFSVGLMANKNGRATRTSILSDGCGGSGCHGTSESSNTTLSVTSNSGSFTVEPGETLNATISVMNSSAVAVGVNIGVKTSITGDDAAGQLTSGSGSKNLFSELVHEEPKEMSGNKAEFSFSWKAPQKPGTYYLRAIGNAIMEIDDSPSSNDEWNWMEAQAVTVRGIELTEPLGGEQVCAGEFIDIRWDYAGIENVKVELSTNGGQSWPITLVDNFKANSNYYRWNIPNDFQQGENFRVRVTSTQNSQYTTQSDASFSIYGPFQITRQPQSQNICRGNQLKLYVETEGGGLTYQWRRNGNPMTGETDSVLIINNAGLGAQGFYGCEISSPCGATKATDDAEINIWRAPEIETQPTDKFACEGETIQFTVMADGTQIEFQWYKDGKEIKGETMPDLTITGVTPEQMGIYHVEVSGPCEPAAKSDEVELRIKSQPVLISGPASQSICENKKLVIEAVAEGLDLKYTWYKDGNEVPNSNQAKFEFNQAKSYHAGVYYVVVENGCGEPVFSEEANIEVNLLPRILTDPDGATVLENDRVEFEITANGENLSYQWRKNGQDIEGANTEKYQIESATTEDAGEYDCVVTNDCGSVTSKKAELVVNAPDPGPRLSLSSNMLDLGVGLLEIEKHKTYEDFFKNVGDEPLEITLMSLDGDEAFNLLQNEIPINLEPGESENLILSFFPESEGDKYTQLTIISNSIVEPGLVDVTGFGGIYNMSTNVDVVEFGTVEIGENSRRDFRLWNQSNFEVEVSGIEIEGAPEGVVEVDEEFPLMIGMASYEEFDLVFSPESETMYEGNIIVHFSDFERTQSLGFTGTGEPNSVYGTIEEISSVEIYPNPAENIANVKVNCSESFNMKYELLTAEGAATGISGEKFLGGDGLISFGTEGLASGMYIFVMRTATGYRAELIMIAK
jgi:hypothetical protein